MIAMAQKAKAVFEVERADGGGRFLVTVATPRKRRVIFTVADCLNPEEALAVVAEWWGKRHPDLVAGHVVECDTSSLDTAQAKGEECQISPERDDSERPF